MSTLYLLLCTTLRHKLPHLCSQVTTKPQHTLIHVNRPLQMGGASTKTIVEGNQTILSLHGKALISILSMVALMGVAWVVRWLIKHFSKKHRKRKEFIQKLMIPPAPIPNMLLGPDSNPFPPAYPGPPLHVHIPRITRINPTEAMVNRMQVPRFRDPMLSVMSPPPTYPVSAPMEPPMVHVPTYARSLAPVAEVSQSSMTRNPTLNSIEDDKTRFVEMSRDMADKD